MSTIIDSKTEAGIVETILSVAFQSIFYGAYAALAAAFIVRSPRERWGFALGLTAFMFTLSTVFWGVTVANLIDLIHRLRGGVEKGFNLTDANNLGNAVILINALALAEGVIVWRARVHWKGENRIGVKVAVFFWILTVLSVIATIVIRIALTVIVDSGKTVPPAGKTAIRAAQAAGAIFAIFANITSTTLIFIQIRRTRSSSSRVEPIEGLLGIFTLLLETGVLYLINVILGLVFSLVRLPSGTLGDLYEPVAAQIAGVNTTLIFLLNHDEGGDGIERTTFIAPSTDRLGAYTNAYSDDA